jgi:hypothetical protein
MERLLNFGTNHAARQVFNVMATGGGLGQETQVTRTGDGYKYRRLLTDCA